MPDLNELHDQIRVCTACGLHQSRKHAVPGEGPETSRIMFIGEGPGFHEDQQGRPFVGAAGQFLDELLETNGLKREEVFITNLVKCRPPGNRDPREEELQACTSRYLDKQIEALDPSVIVTLGRFSMSRYFPNAKISRIHGQPKVVDGRMVVPMYHPAAALHQPSLRSIVEADFAKLPEMISGAHPAEAAAEDREDPPEQLSLF